MPLALLAQGGSHEPGRGTGGGGDQTQGDSAGGAGIRPADTQERVRLAKHFVRSFRRYFFQNTVPRSLSRPLCACMRERCHASIGNHLRRSATARSQVGVRHLLPASTAGHLEKAPVATRLLILMSLHRRPGRSGFALLPQQSLTPPPPNSAAAAFSAWRSASPNREGLRHPQSETHARARTRTHAHTRTHARTHTHTRARAHTHRYAASQTLSHGPAKDF